MRSTQFLGLSQDPARHATAAKCWQLLLQQDAGGSQAHRRTEFQEQRRVGGQDLEELTPQRAEKMLHSTLLHRLDRSPTHTWSAHEDTEGIIQDTVTWCTINLFPPTGIISSRKTW